MAARSLLPVCLLTSTRRRGQVLLRPQRAQVRRAGQAAEEAPARRPEAGGRGRRRRCGRGARVRGGPLPAPLSVPLCVNTQDCAWLEKGDIDLAMESGHVAMAKGLLHWRFACPSPDRITFGQSRAQVELGAAADDEGGDAPGEGQAKGGGGKGKGPGGGPGDALGLGTTVRNVLRAMGAGVKQAAGKGAKVRCPHPVSGVPGSRTQLGAQSRSAAWVELRWPVSMHAADLMVPGLHMSASRLPNMWYPPITCSKAAALN